MSYSPSATPDSRERTPSVRGVRRTHRLLNAGAILATFGLTATIALAPPAPPSDAALLHAYALQNPQQLEVDSFTVAAHLEATSAVERDSFTSTPGIVTLAQSGTNHDWAKMVLLFAKWPMTEANITVITRWMRQENYVDSWWTRNNPLNNGWGASYGPGGTGSNVSLVKAAENAADALLTNPGYAGIRAAFAKGTDTAEIERAIWASPWASGHYNNGKHWHYTPVPVITAPASAWGL